VLKSKLRVVLRPTGAPDLKVNGLRELVIFLKPLKKS